MKILTVLRSGGEYNKSHVERLRKQCKRYAPDAEFICLSDVDIEGVKTIPLEHDWPTWWGKIETFKISGPVLYIDLDTTVRGDLTPFFEIAEKYKFTALRDFNPRVREMGSGLMAWNGDMSYIYDNFCEAPEQHMTRCSTLRYFGDQGFIEPLTKGRTYWQELMPNAVVSWKKHCRWGIPKDARIVCFHGKPRPWDVKH